MKIIATRLLYLVTRTASTLSISVLFLRIGTQPQTPNKPSTFFSPLSATLLRARLRDYPLKHGEYINYRRDFNTRTHRLPSFCRSAEGTPYVYGTIEHFRNVQAAPICKIVPDCNSANVDAYQVNTYHM